MKPSDALREFHAALGETYGDGGTPGLREKLHEEEHKELMYALANESIGQVAKELADIVYVAYGTAFSLGIPLDAVFAEVHKSNMTKFPATLRADGKLLKSPNYQAPDVEKVLKENQ